MARLVLGIFSALAACTVSAIDHPYEIPSTGPAAPHSISRIGLNAEAQQSIPVFEARLDGIYMNGAPFNFKGANYFGMETDILVPHGLWGGDKSTSIQKIATFLKSYKFNAVRLPFAVDAVLQNLAVDPKNLANEVAFLSAYNNKTVPYLDVLDHTIKVFGDNQLLVLLEAHKLNYLDKIGEVWYTSDSDKNNFENAWKILAARYKDTWNVVGADLKNEPHGKATWGSNDVKTDWRLAALQWSTSILSIVPRWLIFVEGTERSSRDDLIKPAPWGGNFRDLERANLTLAVPNRLVLSPHAYGPDVLPLMPYLWSWFIPKYPENLPEIWDFHFGFAHQKFGPVVLGEWGGKYRADWDKKWENRMAKYLKDRGIGWFYWCINPNGGDTEGLLDADWNTPRSDKLEMMSIFEGTPIA